MQAIPHVLVFEEDVRVNDDTDGDQTDPDLAANADGTRLYLAWEDGGAVDLATSEDFGASWVLSERPTASGSDPAVGVRSAVVDEEGNETAAEVGFLAWEEGGEIVVASYDVASATFGEPVSVGAGTTPDIALGDGTVHVVFAEGNAIHHALSTDGGASFGAPVSLSAGLTQTQAPSVAVH